MYDNDLNQDLTYVERNPEVPMPEDNGKKKHKKEKKPGKGTQNDLDSINGLNEWIDGKINGTTGEGSKPVTNPYADQQWTMAYVCNNGTWSNTPLTAANGDTIPEVTRAA